MFEGPLSSRFCYIASVFTIVFSVLLLVAEKSNYLIVFGLVLGVIWFVLATGKARMDK